MMTIALLSFFLGALLALRWNLFVLVPAIGGALPLVALICVARGGSAGSIVVDMALAATCIEVGYMARPVVYALVDAAGIGIMTAIKRRMAFTRAAENQVRSGKGRPELKPEGLLPAR